MNQDNFSTAYHSRMAMMFKGENASDFILSALPVHTLVSVFFISGLRLKC